MTLPENARVLRTNELPPLGSLVYVPENTAAFAGGRPAPGWQTVLDTIDTDGTIGVKSAENTRTSWVLSHNLLVDDKAPRPKVGDWVRINAPEERRHGHVGEIVEDDGSSLPYFVRFERFDADWFSPNEVGPVSDGDTFPGEEDTTAPASVRHETVVTLAAPATAFQISRALALIPLGWFTTVDTYADRIEIIGRHHEETRG